MMKKRFRDVIDTIEYDDLMKMKKDLDDGAVHLSKLIDEKVKEEQKKHEQVCTVCSKNIDQYDTNNLTLLFGPDDLKKKATFCALDCLEYFINNLKEMKTKKVVE